MWDEPPFVPVLADLIRLDSRLACLEAESESGCWLWPRCKNYSGRNRLAAYGRIKRRNRSTAPAAFVHRYVYELIWGKVPLDYDVHHLCGVTLCCNPAHLEPRERREHRQWHGRRKRK